jgi:hypothetical protein
MQMKKSLLIGALAVAALFSVQPARATERTITWDSYRIVLEGLSKTYECPARYSSDRHPAGTGVIFLVIDLEVTNTGLQPTNFYPAQFVHLVAANGARYNCALTEGDFGSGELQPGISRAYQCYVEVPESVLQAPVSLSFSYLFSKVGQIGLSTEDLADYFKVVPTTPARADYSGVAFVFVLTVLAIIAIPILMVIGIIVLIVKACSKKESNA